MVAMAAVRVVRATVVSRSPIGVAMTKVRSRWIWALVGRPFALGRSSVGRECLGSKLGQSHRTGRAPIESLSEMAGGGWIGSRLRVARPDRVGDDGSSDAQVRALRREEVTVLVGSGMGMSSPTFARRSSRALPRRREMEARPSGSTPCRGHAGA
jgi:hypothetical protein